MKSCNWCDKTFKPAVTYQIYCSSLCREQATKEKIAARYLITRRKKRKNKPKKCVNCNEELSIYNEDALCNSCVINPKEVAKILKKIKGMSDDK